MGLRTLSADSSYGDNHQPYYNPNTHLPLDLTSYGLKRYGGGVIDQEGSNAYQDGNDYIAHCLMWTIAFFAISCCLLMLCTSHLPDVDTSKSK